MKIIDFDKKGNVVRFLLGNDVSKSWGDDWDDAPYEHNAGPVYDNYVMGRKDIAFPFDDLVLEPCAGVLNSHYSKQDMQSRKVPCIIVVPYALHKDEWCDDFNYWVGADGIKKYYFGDEMEPEAIPEFDEWPSIVGWKNVK